MAVKSDKDRIKEVMKYLKIGETKFESLVGWGNGSITKMNEESNLSTDKIRKVVSVIPNINVTWLVTGKGDMFTKKHIEVVGKVDSNSDDPNSNQQDLSLGDVLLQMKEDRSAILKAIQNLSEKIETVNPSKLDKVKKVRQVVEGMPDKKNKDSRVVE